MRAGEDTKSLKFCGRTLQTPPHNKSRDQQNFSRRRVPHLHGGIYQSRVRRCVCLSHIDQTSISRSLLMLRPDRGPNDKKVARDRTDTGSLQGRACAQESPRWDLKTQTTFQSVYECSPPFREDFKSPGNKRFISALSFVVSDSTPTITTHCSRLSLTLQVKYHRSGN